MDKMFWFGWLFKGQMEVSFLDKVLFFVEAFALVVAILFIFGLSAEFEKWKAKRKGAPK